MSTERPLRAAVACLALLAVFASGNTAAADPDAAFVKSQLVGGKGGKYTLEITSGQKPDAVAGHLVGLKITLGKWGPNTSIKSVQPVYFRRDLKRVESTNAYGIPNGRPVLVEAPRGYAVGGIRIKGGDRVDGLSLIFMRVVGTRLDTTDSRESGWHGGMGGGEKTLLGGDGLPVIGLQARRGLDLDALGIIQYRTVITAQDRWNALARAARRNLTKAQVNALSREIRRNKRATGRRRGGVRITVWQPAYFLLLNGVIGQGWVLHLDARHVVSVVENRVYDYPSDWYVAVQTIRGLYVFDHHHEQFKAANLEEVLALTAAAQDIRAARMQEYLRSARQADPLERLARWMENRWANATPQQRQKVKDIAREMARGWRENMKAAVVLGWNHPNLGGGVSGVVKYPNGKPYRFKPIRGVHGPSEEETKTDEDGKFHFPTLDVVKRVVLPEERFSVYKREYPLSKPHRKKDGRLSVTLQRSR